VVELYKEYVHKQGYYSKYLVVYAVLLIREELDEQLRKIRFRNIGRIKFISFWVVNIEDRLGLLHWNECNNVNVKYNILYETNLEEIVEN